MTAAAQHVAELEAIDQQARALMHGPLEALRNLPDPTPFTIGADPSKIDPERPSLGNITAYDGMELEGVTVDRIFPGNARDVHLKDIKGVGGKPPGAPRPIIDCSAPACEGWLLEGVTVEPTIRTVMWSDGIRLGRLATAKRLLIRGTVDGLAIVTPTGKRTCLDLEDALIEDLHWSPTDPNHTDGTHNDPIQFHGPLDGAKMRRLTLHLGTKGTAGIMANVPSVNDFHLADSDLTGAKSGVNFGPTWKATGTLAIVDTRFDSPVDVYCTDTLASLLRLDRSTRADGTPAKRTRS